MQFGWRQFFLALLSLILSCGASKYAEHYLISSLLDDYLRTARPLMNASQALQVNFRLQLLSMDIDEKDHLISILSWDTAEWTDEYLPWNPRDHSSIAQTYLQENVIWTPDITLFNIADGPESLYSKAYARLSYNGHITWTRTAKHKSPCKLTLALFPFDTQTCILNFGSTMYDGHKLDLKLGGISLSSYSPNVRWWLRKASSERVVAQYPCCPEPYITLVFQLTLQRQATYYIYTLLVPTFLLSLFTLVSYLIPHHRSEKITLGVTLFVSFFLLLIAMQYLVPLADDIPYFVYYLCFNLALLALSTFLNSIIVNSGSPKNIRDVPWLLKRLTECFARLLCISSIVRKIHSRHLLAADIGLGPLANSYYTLPLQDKKQRNSQASLASLCDEDQPESVSHRYAEHRRTDSDMGVIKAFTKRYEDRMVEEENKKELIEDWMDVASVMNRLFFVFCLFVDVGAIVAYFMLIFWPW